MTPIWTIEKEAARLHARFETISQAKFARENKVPGGASMVSQHIKGRRPINLEAALAYARGFKCSLEEISPRLAEDLTLRSRPPLLKFSIGTARCIDEKFEPQGKRVDLCLDAQALELEHRVNGHEDVVALGSERLSR